MCNGGNRFLIYVYVKLLLLISLTILVLIIGISLGFLVWTHWLFSLSPVVQPENFAVTWQQCLTTNTTAAFVGVGA